MKQRKRSKIIWLFLLVLLGVGCVSSTPRTAPVKVSYSTPMAAPEVVEIAALVSASERVPLKVGSGIVVAEMRDSIRESCGAFVRLSLMSRLAENPQYRVVTRDNLSLLIQELDDGWAGNFDTRTVKRLGKLLGASVFIFGDVLYCGKSAADSPDSETGEEFNIVALLQAIDPETGRITMATTVEGVFLPRISPSLPFRNRPDDPTLVVEDGGPGETPQPTRLRQVMGSISRITDPLKQVTRNIADSLPYKEDLADGAEVAANVNNLASGFGQDTDQSAKTPKSKQKKKPSDEPLEYQKHKAAEDLAAQFADRFYARPTWERLEMWRDERWMFDQSVRLVQLGQCPTAVRVLKGEAARQLPSMSDRDVGRYLHNFGVALMCSNEPERALEKLRASYRVGYNKTTLRMIGVATRLTEWKLRAEINYEDEIKMLLNRMTLPI